MRSLGRPSVLRPDEPPLLPARLRTATHGVAAVALAGLVLLAGRVAGQEQPTRVDELVGVWAPPHSRAFELLGDAGAIALPLAMPAVALALAAICWQASARRAAVFCVAAPAASMAVTAVLKPLVARPSASGDGWMFPSGHVAVVASVAMVTAVLLLPGGALADALVPPRVVYTGWALIAAAAAGASIGTVVGGYHHATDVLGALLVAVVTPLAVAESVDRWPRHRVRVDPVTSEPARSGAGP